MRHNKENIAGEDLIRGLTWFPNLEDEGVVQGFAKIQKLTWSLYLRARPSTSPWQGKFH